MAKGLPELAVTASVAIALAVLAAGCGSMGLVAPAVDYRSGVRVIEIREFDDTAQQRPEPTIFYNLKTEEGRRQAARAGTKTREAAFTYAVAHNAAIRLDEAREALEAAGLAVPVIRVVTRAHPMGLVATGSAFGTGFEYAPPGLPPAEVHVGGAVRPDPEADLLTASFEIEEASGTERYVLTDSAGQLIARIADHLSPHRLSVQRAETPVAFVRHEAGAGAIEVDLGLERRVLHVARVLDGERVPVHRYVRIGYRGGPTPPEDERWPRIEVEEPPPAGGE